MPTKKKPHNSTILLIDDEASSLDIIESILSGQTYTIEYASNGLRALELALTLRPDLVLLDVMMPGMDGFEVCRRIRSTPELAEVPIIILTALDDSNSRLEGIEAGADDFLSKPINRQELRARVGTITRLNRYRILLEQRESLRHMARRVVTTQENERKRISRELHDEMGQALTAHNIKLHTVLDEIPPELPQLKQAVTELIAETNDLLQRAGALAHGLRPPMLDIFGLKLAIETYCRDFSTRTNLPVHLDIDPTLPELPDLCATTLYRITQEMLTNIVKHAQASQVWVELRQEDDWIALTVQDNGQGFPSQGSPNTGLGLVGIRERLELAGGKLDIRSSAGKGSVLSASLPITC